MRRLILAASLAAAACTQESTPDVSPMTLQVPAPPAPAPGEIRMYGHGLSEERAGAIRERLRAAESDIAAEFASILEGDPYAAGMLQLRIGVNTEGDVAEVTAVRSDVNNALLEQRSTALIRAVRFDPGVEAYAYYTLAFPSQPFEVLAIRPEFSGESPALAIDAVNRSAFHLADVAVTVSVLDSERAAPLRISRRRLRAPFRPGERRTLWVPVGAEWASERYSFLAAVRPVSAAEPPAR